MGWYDGWVYARFADVLLSGIHASVADHLPPAVIVLALHEIPSRSRPAVVQRLTAVAHRVIAVDFSVPLPTNLAGLLKRGAELVAGPAHFTGFRNYVEGGGLDGILAEASGVRVVDDRTIDHETLRVLTMTAA